MIEGGAADGRGLGTRMNADRTGGALRFLRYRLAPMLPGYRESMGRMPMPRLGRALRFLLDRLAPMLAGYRECMGGTPMLRWDERFASGWSAVVMLGGAWAVEHHISVNGTSRERDG